MDFGIKFGELIECISYIYGLVKDIYKRVDINEENEKEQLR